MTSKASSSHELVILKSGAASVKNRMLGEAMHSLIGPEEEARILYIEQSQLSARLALTKESGPLVLYDVGLGIGANALSAIRCFQENGRCRELKILSFENDLSSIELAIQNSADFPFLIGFEDVIRTLICAGSVRLPGVEWVLKRGDFTVLDLGEGARVAPEIIFFDFYSPKATPNLWMTSTFEKLHRICSLRLEHGLPTWLYTYCSSTAARNAMMLAGFYVGVGNPTPAKRETTAACSLPGFLKSPLSPDWIEHTIRSAKPLPSDAPKNAIDIIKATIKESSPLGSAQRTRAEGGD